jgi:hypothetical protein
MKVCTYYACSSLIYDANNELLSQEAFMTQQTKDQQPKHKQPYPSAPVEDVNKQKAKAEEHEVAGRHKNDGQKDHKGAR